MRIPDDFFQLSQAISFQYYNLKNYYTGLFTFGEGKSNNISYTVALSRDNTFTNPSGNKIGLDKILTKSTIDITDIVVHEELAPNLIEHYPFELTINV